MQSLASDFAITFVDDAAALISGCGRIILQTVTAPIERLANACDVAGVLPNRRSSFHMQRAKSGASSGKRKAHQARRRWCVFSFGFLGDLT